MILKLQITFVFTLTRLVENILPDYPKHVTNNWENLCAREINVTLSGSITIRNVLNINK